MLFKKIGAAIFVAAVVGLTGFYAPVHAQAPDMGSARTFAVLGATTVTNTGATAVTGDVGVSPGTAITGFSAGTVSQGTVYAGGPVPTQAEADLAIAYSDLAGRASIPANNLSGQDLGGMTLAPGVYHFNTAATLGAPLTLDAKGDDAAVFIFQIGTTLITGSNTSVILRGGARADNVFWQVGSSATLGAAGSLQGSILAYTSITLTHGASLNGRAMAENGAVTMDTNMVLRPFPWRATAFATGPDNLGHILWQRYDGLVSLWNLTADGTTFSSSHDYGPSPDWSANGLAVGPDGITHILWRRGNDGLVDLWNMTADQTGIASDHSYGPSTDWAATNVAVGPDGITHILWRRTADGLADLWNMTADQTGIASDHTYGPSTDWAATNVAVGPDGITHILWRQTTDGSTQLWNMTADQTAITSYHNYGPSLAWVANGLSVGPDGTTHILWNHAADGIVELWNLTADQSAVESASNFGPR